MSAERSRTSPAGPSAILFAVCALIAACTPMRSTIQPPFPYRGMEYTEPQIQLLAGAYCESTPNPSQPMFAYTTDGCSMVPDGTWRECCIEHDIKYWCGGTLAARLDADRELRQCLTSEAGPARARLMYFGTRVAGWPRVPFGWRWGYGYRWPHRPESEPADPESGAAN